MDSTPGDPHKVSPDEKSEMNAPVLMKHLSAEDVTNETYGVGGTVASVYLLKPNNPDETDKHAESGSDGAEARYLSVDEEIAEKSIVTRKSKKSPTMGGLDPYGTHGDKIAISGVRLIL